ncbi:MAG: hypothetical protein KC421_09185, partial [Anaerolineales bacterium]|nr:hypothetical protein [Anaerolineales bacterium]
MIHFNGETNTFSLILSRSHYVMQVDSNGRLRHLAWGPRPTDAAAGDLIDGKTWYEHGNFATMEQQARPDEFITFGDVSYHEVSLKANFATLPQAMQTYESPL